MAKYFLTESTAVGLKRLLAASRDISASGVSRTIPGDGESLELPVREDVWRLEWNTTLNAFVILCGEHALTIDGTEISVGGLTAATSPLNDTDWKTVDSFTGGDLWLVITAGSTTSATVSSSPGSGDNTRNILIATATVDATTGAIDIKQNIVGALALGAAGVVSSLETDQKSVALNDGGKVELKGWKSQNAEATTLAERLDVSSSTSAEVVVRDGGKNGVVKFVPIGTFSSSGSTSAPTLQFVGDVKYDVSDHQLKKRVDSVNLRTGAVTQGAWVMIEGGQATPHTAEHS